MAPSPVALSEVTVLASLRDATHGLHKALDTHLAIAHPDATLGDYVAHLRILHGWLAPLERWLADDPDGPQLGRDPRLYCHTHAIEADLTEAGTIAPVSEAVLPSGGRAYRWGHAYVAAGSQLGGAMLYRRLGPRLAPHRLRYFSGERISPAIPWSEFVARLEAALVTPGDLQRCRQGAIDAFTILSERFRAAGHFK